MHLNAIKCVLAFFRRVNFWLARFLVVFKTRLTLVSFKNHQKTLVFKTS